jgi:hypothetical protein
MAGVIVGLPVFRCTAIAVASAAALALGTTPTIAAPAAPTGATVATDAAGTRLPAATGYPWVATAQNGQGKQIYATDPRKNRAKKLALRRCRTSKLTRHPHSCHITDVHHGGPLDGSDAGEPWQR